MASRGRQMAHFSAMQSRKTRTVASASAVGSSSPSSSGDLRTTPTVIVGGGPAGYAAALLLAHHGWSAVSLVERSISYNSTEGPSGEGGGGSSGSGGGSASAQRSFSYLVHPRAMKAIAVIPGLLPLLLAEGVLNRDVSLALHKPNGKTMTFPKLFRVVSNASSSSTDKPSFWIRRSRFLQILSKHLHDNYQGQIRVLHSTECFAMDIGDDGRFKLHLRRVQSNNDDNVNKEENAPRDECMTLDAALLLACDGVNSVVRSELLKNENANVGASSDKCSSVISTRGFGMDSWMSPAVGLHYKTVNVPALQVVARPSSATEEPATALPNEIHLFAGSNTNREARKIFNIGFLPVGSDNSSGRFGTIVRKGDHDVWRLSTVEDAFKMFEENFPQMRVRELILPNEMENFVCARSSAFPPVQRCRSLVGLTGVDRYGEGGVALLGDAAHCFPPDLGLGVNSALEDAFLLCNILEQEATVPDGGSIHSALNAYADMRDVDTSALMRMMISGGPYQYGQSVWRARLWRLHMSLRSILARAFPSIFSPHLFMLGTSDLRFSEIMANEDATTNRIITSLLILVSIAFAVLVHRS